jgi:hypothetical protein
MSETPVTEKNIARIADALEVIAIACTQQFIESDSRQSRIEARALVSSRLTTLMTRMVANK